MPDHPGGLRPPPLLKRGGENNILSHGGIKRGGENNILAPGGIASPAGIPSPGGIPSPAGIRRGGENNVVAIIFPSSHEEGCPRSGRGGKWHK